MSVFYREAQPDGRRKAVALLVVMLCVVAAGCDPSLPEVAGSTDLSGHWAFASRWVAGRITISDTPQGDLNGHGRMAASPLEGTWKATQHNLVLDLQNTCPILGSWKASDMGGELRGFTTDAELRMGVNIRLAERAGATAGSPGERLAGTLLGSLSEDGRQIEGHVREIEGRLSSGSLDEVPVLLERQSTPFLHPLSLNGTRVDNQVQFAFDVSISGECRGIWHFSGTILDERRLLNGVIEHSVYGTFPVLFTRE